MGWVPGLSPTHALCAALTAPPAARACVRATCHDARLQHVELAGFRSLCGASFVNLGPATQQLEVRNSGTSRPAPPRPAARRPAVYEHASAGGG